MIFYFTYNDAPSGIYNSQVIDVVKCLNQRKNTHVRLIAFISFRKFYLNRRLIKNQLADAIIVPMIPKIENWKLNRFILYFFCLLFRPETIIARSVLAASISLFARKNKLTKKVCYDGRGAIKAEWNEYNVVGSKLLKNNIAELEKTVVIESDHRIAVSRTLVNYWKSEFNFDSSNYSIIPCTLSNDFCDLKYSLAEINLVRKENGYSDGDILLIYSGSSAGWQSFELLQKLIIPQLKMRPALKLLFLAKPDDHILMLQREFPLQINYKWINHEEVPKFLMIGDYGLLIREQSMTNQVASPVKFAEYLSCGLSVIISEELGDYSEFVTNNNCGKVVKLDTSQLIDLRRSEANEKQKNVELANTYFNKGSAINSEKYNSLLKSIIAGSNE